MRQRAVVLSLLLLLSAVPGSNPGDPKPGPGPAIPAVDTSRLLRVPDHLRYPGAEPAEVYRGPASGYFVFRTVDSLPAVLDFYKRVVDSMSLEGFDEVGISGGSPGDFEAFEFTTEDDRRGLFGFLIKQDSGTAIIITRWQLR